MASFHLFISIVIYKFFSLRIHIFFIFLLFNVIMGNTISSGTGIKIAR